MDDGERDWAYRAYIRCGSAPDGSGDLIRGTKKSGTHTGFVRESNAVFARLAARKDIRVNYLEARGTPHDVADAILRDTPDEWIVVWPSTENEPPDVAEEETSDKR
jgi:hypothetical protein